MIGECWTFYLTELNEAINDAWKHNKAPCFCYSCLPLPDVVGLVSWGTSQAHRFVQRATRETLLCVAACELYFSFLLLFVLIPLFWVPSLTSLGWLLLFHLLIVFTNFILSHFIYLTCRVRLVILTVVSESSQWVLNRLRFSGFCCWCFFSFFMQEMIKISWTRPYCCDSALTPRSWHHSWVELAYHMRTTP